MECGRNEGTMGKEAKDENWRKEGGQEKDQE